MHEIELSSGTIEYSDTGGNGRIVVFLHGLLMDGSLWAETMAELLADHRCIAPTLPLGAHRHGMRPDSDLSLPAIARVRVLRSVAAEPQLLVQVASALSGFDRPVLVVWATEDRVMPLEHGRRLAGLFPQGHLVEVDDSYTLVPLDRPVELAKIIREFTGGVVATA